MPASLARATLTEADVAGIVHLVLTARDTWQDTDEEIDLGTAVRVSLAGGRTRSRMTEEGVVIELVPPGKRPLAARIAPHPCSRRLERYVVQCWACRVLRPAVEMLVISR